MGEIRFVGTGETRGYPYPVCKKIFYREAFKLVVVKSDFINKTVQQHSCSSYY